jgi:hypothetical protein
MIEKIPDNEIYTLIRLGARLGGEEAVKLSIVTNMAKKINELIEYINKNTVH